MGPQMYNCFKNDMGVYLYLQSVFNLDSNVQYIYKVIMLY